MAQCPFCMTEIHDEATVCRGCGAQKGYTTAAGRVYGKSQTIGYGIVLPAIFLVLPFPFFGLRVATLLWGAVLAIPIVLSANRLRGNGVWYR
jgi:hypothetical protein